MAIPEKIRILSGDETLLRSNCGLFEAQPVDQEMMDGDSDFEWDWQTTLGKAVSEVGPGTFLGKEVRTVTFVPTRDPGWAFDRTDLPDLMPINVSIKNIWKTVRNIVLCSGPHHNYMRMVEHIVALKTGLGVDCLTIKMDSGDPPLFDRSSSPLVEAFDSANIVKLPAPALYFTVKEPVAVVAPNGSFLAFLPAQRRDKRLLVDCAIDFKNAIGKQRIKFSVNRKTFRHGAQARTNTNLWMMLYTKTIGKIFADVRNLGYTMDNILIAGPRKYINKPLLMHNGKSLEAVWHRATLDLLAAVALIDKGRFAGTILSYKAGHALDVQMIRELYQNDLLVQM